MVSSVVSEVISIDSAIRMENGKGGEKGMASEWEELEKLTKEELIIELVKERTAHRELCRNMRMLIESDYPADDERYFIEGESDDEWPGHRTTDEWARRIILYAKAHSDDPEFGYTDAIDYGLLDDQAVEVFGRLAEEGLLDWYSADPRSRRFSGIIGMYADEVAELDPEERERRMRETREELS